MAVLAPDARPRHDRPHDWRREGHRTLFHPSQLNEPSDALRCLLTSGADEATTDSNRPPRDHRGSPAVTCTTTATVWVRADLAAGRSPRALERRPLSEQLGVQLGGATQTITAVSATKQDAGLLGVPKGAPLLRVERTTWDADGRPVLRSEARYNPLLTELVADLPPAMHDIEPGLRLIAQPARD